MALLSTRIFVGVLSVGTVSLGVTFQDRITELFKPQPINYLCNLSPDEGVFFMSPTGDDTNSGTRTSPYKTLLTSLNKLEPGNTLCVFPGRYQLQEEALSQWGAHLVSKVGGTAKKPIKVIGTHPLKKPVFTAEISDFRHHGAWEQVNGSVAVTDIVGTQEIRTSNNDEDNNSYYIPRYQTVNYSVSSGQQLYRSKNTFDELYANRRDSHYYLNRKANLANDSITLPDGEKTSNTNTGVVFSGHWNSPKRENSLIAYWRFSDLINDQTAYPLSITEAADSSYYVGPGVFFNTADNRIYIRLSCTPTMIEMEECSPQLNPNHHDLKIFNHFDTITFRDTANIQFINIAFHHFSRIILETTGGLNNTAPPTRNMQFRRNDFKLALTQGSGSLLVRANAINTQVTQSHFNGLFPAYIYWTDVKHGMNLVPDEGKSLLGPAHGLHGGLITASDTQEISVKDSSLERAFFGFSAGRGVSDMEIHKTVFNEIRNDAVLLNASNCKADISDNVITGSFAGISQSSGNKDVFVEPPASCRSTIYIHHNLVSTAKTACGRPPYDKADYLGIDGDGMCENRCFGAHGSQPAAWNIYNNTCVSRTNIVVGHGHYHLSAHSETPRYIFNNIFVQNYEQGIGFANAFLDSPDGKGKIIADGNVYWRNIESMESNEPLAPFISRLKFVNDNNTVAQWTQSYTSLNEFIDSDAFRRTQRWYPQGLSGMEARSVQSDPLLDEHLRPANASPANSSRFRVSDYFADWPKSNSTYIGACSPQSNNDACRLLEEQTNN